MARAAITIPDESDLLCEGCGYTLNGLPAEGNCPECGKSIAQSLGHQRTATAWEGREGRTPRLVRFSSTAAEVIFRPTHFYRTFATRGGLSGALGFARVNWVLASLGFAAAAYLHANWYRSSLMRRADLSPALFIVFFIASYASLSVTTRLAAKLTTWEAAYRGYRLPMPVVLRGLYYHAAHYLPVAIVAAATVIVYRLLLWRAILGATSAQAYLYLLCAEVIVGAVYLFNTYWIGMRNMMYANR